jgi:hypothetical protein
VVNRATNAKRKFLSCPSVTGSLLAVGGVVLFTAFTTGGLGMQAMGSEHHGGKGYFYILIAIAGYFAFISQSVPVEKAGLYVAMFFLPGLTSVVSNLAFTGGKSYWFLFEMFPAEMALTQAMAEYSPMEVMVRIAGVVWAAQVVWCWLLARHGVVGVLDLTRPWRLLLFVAALFGGLFGGFRSAIIQFALVFAVLFFIERLWRTRVVLYLAAGTVAAGVVLAACSDQLSPAVQRSLSFLPIKIDAAVRQDAENSTAWRVQMWQTIMPEVPKYIFKGKGYALNPQDMYLMTESVMRGYVSSTDAALMSGDYHNGPLSVVIPFGIYGVAAFAWFFTASLRLLYRHYRQSRPELQTLNNFLLALFVGRLLFFLFVYGSIYGELFGFVGLVGMSIAFNTRTEAETETVQAGLAETQQA